ncbi:alpha/beta hydrolase [Anaerobacillus sp. CMMVII]|uniref:alpha/beta hydrolase n=1 Tax=Anaerobacillus sp. CMMVII TaxID=2755588 RepID=UPI0021B75022|nr:alpha/beta hydrolase [Anaerobacillus sp. CMMVII]MCT8138172.1 alpha/beta hydrolase [Anaerobacillus sp. CMMVII]
MKKVIKKIFVYLAAVFLIFISYVILSVHYWSTTDEGILPPKTAVILHAVNNNIITSDMKPPKFLIQPRPSTIAREDIMIPVAEGQEIAGRVYYPKSDGGHPVLMYYHGGAFLDGYGNIETHDNIIRAIAARTNSVVIAVGYRVAPQYVFPTAVEDSYEALLWAYQQAERFNGDPDRIAVIGDSAGGNLATAVALMSRDFNGPPLTAQALLYPLTTFQDVPLQSRIIYDSGYYLLSRNVMYRARELYTPMEDMWLSPYTSPLNAESLEALPPTLIITAEYDPLRDEGEQYAERLAEAGIPVTHLHYEGVMHGFISFYEVMNLGEHGLRETVSFLKNVFSDETKLDSGLEKSIVSSPRGREGIREYLEAYAIAAFLLYKDIIG